MKILVTDRFTTESLEKLRQNLKCEIVKTEHKPKREEYKGAVAMLIRSRTLVNEKLLSEAPDLKVIVTATNGFDHIDLKACASRDIKVMYTPDANTESAAELTILLLLGVLRRMTETAKVLKDGGWKDLVGTGFELKGKTVGIIGLGRVGSRVAEILQCFGADVIAYDPYQKDEVFKKLGIPKIGLTEVLAQAEILSLHVPLTAETRRMIRAETLELTNEGLILINTSRGQVIDESALAAGLESQQIAMAGLDVFEHEPLSRDSRLRRHPNVLLTPHIGAYTEEAFTRASNMATDRLMQFLKNGEMSDELLP